MRIEGSGARDCDSVFTVCPIIVSALLFRVGVSGFRVKGLRV